MSQIIHDTVTLNVSSLSAGGVVLGATKIDAAQSNGFRVKRVRAALAYEQKTADLGPIVIGFSRNLTSTEVKEALDADPQGNNDIPETEQGNRAVWPEWLVPASGSTDNREHVKFEDIYWPYKEADEDSQFSAWAHNIDGATITAGLIVIQIVWYGDWMRD